MERQDKIAILATGEELLTGDILNTNSQFLAQQLLTAGIQPGMQMVVGDNEAEIEATIQHLLQKHRGLIITGGLGPTSDDRTRFALAKYLKSDLVFDEPTWERVVARITSVGLDVPENNKQQCLFPEGAEILINHNGTAAGCWIKNDDAVICMLPGPPSEVHAIVHESVMPRLLQCDFAAPIPQNSWLLLGVSEGSLANELDPLFQDIDAEVGYRVAFPYIELKISSRDAALLDKLSNVVATRFKDAIVSRENLFASEQLCHRLAAETKRRFIFLDYATYGLLQATLTTPETQSKILFTTDEKIPPGDVVMVSIAGLDAFWKRETEIDPNELAIKIYDGGPTKSIRIPIPFRGLRTRNTALELICWEVLKRCF